MSKLLEDEKVAKLVERETAKAVKAERKRVLDAVKELKAEATELDEPKVKRAVAKALTDVNKAVRAA